MQRVVHSTVKRLLNRYVRGNIESIDGSESTIHLKGLMFKEEIINVQLVQFGLQVRSAALDNVRVDVSWSAMSTIHWDGLHVILEPLGDNPSHLSSDTVVSEPPLGSSLCLDSTSEEPQSLLSSITASFSNPIEGMQRRFEDLSTNLLHRISNLEIECNYIFNTRVIVKSAEYSETDGLFIHKAQVWCMTLANGSETSIELSGMKVDLVKKSIKIDELICVLYMNLIVEAQKLFATKEQSEQSEQRPPIFSLSVNSVKLQLDILPPIELSQLKVKANKDLSCGILNVKDCLTVEGFSLLCSHSDEAVLLPEAVKQSPFEDDKIFLFHAKPKPVPIGSGAKMLSFINQAKSSKENISVRAQKISLFDSSALVKLCMSLSNMSLGKSPEVAKLNYTIEAFVDVVCVRENAYPHCDVNEASAFVALDTRMWSAKAQIVKINDVALLQQIRLGGESITHISADIRKAEIKDIVKLIELIPGGQKSDDPFLLIVRIQRIKLQPNKYCNFVLLGDGVEAFTSHHGEAIIITGGRVESANLQLTGLQVYIPIGGSDNADCRPVKVSVANVTGILTPQTVMQIIDQIPATKTEAAAAPPRPQQKEPFEMDTTRVIHDYMSRLRTEVVVCEQPQQQNIKFKITIRQGKIRLSNNQEYIELLVDHFKFQKYQDDRMLILLDKFECLDRLAQSVWNKAVIVRKFSVQIDKNDYQIMIGGGGGAGEPARQEDVTVSLDQNVVDFLFEFMSSCLPPAPPLVKAVAPTLTFHSFHIAPFKARIDYKPGATSGYFRFVPLRGAVIKMQHFDSFDVTPERLGVELALHILNHFRNLPRIIGGIKPLRAPANIFRNIAELVLVPLDDGAGPRNLDGIIAQAKHATVATVISVLELGPALNVRRVGAEPSHPTSVHSMQPSGFKGGLIQARQNFTTDMGTMFAFISGDLRNVDLYDLPLMVLRPLTAPLADIVNGMCNQLDPSRYQRTLDKYR